LIHYIICSSILSNPVRGKSSQGAHAQPCSAGRSQTGQAMKFSAVTLFPDAFDSYLKESIIGRALKDKKISFKAFNPRSFTKDKWKRVDRKPYGGGPGMVLEAESVGKAITKAVATKSMPTGRQAKKKPFIIFFTPSGKEFTNTYADKLIKKTDHIVFVCGRYEGIDARVKKMFKMEEVSVGPYVLTGGELPAMIVMDAVSRRIPGVLGDIYSLEESRTATPDVYTRPEVLVWKGKKLRVPKVLLSGNPKMIEEWKANKNKGK
jgi:tRNA (guanine37-N1)-methyltransferase